MDKFSFVVFQSEENSLKLTDVGIVISLLISASRSSDFFKWMVLMDVQFFLGGYLPN